MNHSLLDDGRNKNWGMALRLITILLGFCQLIFLGWAKYITVQVIQGQGDIVEAKSDVQHIKEDVTYIRQRLDSIVEGRKK